MTTPVLTKVEIYRQALEIAANDPGVPARVRAVCQLALHGELPVHPDANITGVITICSTCGEPWGPLHSLQCAAAEPSLPHECPAMGMPIGARGVCAICDALVVDEPRSPLCTMSAEVYGIECRDPWCRVHGTGVNR